jgi:hypothetical protein
MSDSTAPRPRPRRDRHRLALIATAGLAATSLWVQPVGIEAVPTAPGVVFDDFEDGNASDWTFFGGNAAGGGGGTLDDRPAEGSYYLSTGWGGNGTASVFYGGLFRNLENTAQVEPPVDPWFNMWVLNQSNATVDRYTLEVTLREDTDGNGWSDGSEDSIGFDTVFTSDRFDDRWTLLSAPLSAFVDRGTGGNGSFDGNVDEMVIVISGVEGAVGSVVEVDFDTISFTSGAPAGFDQVVFDDMEHGAPFANGWFTFNGSVGGGGIAANGTDLPPSSGGAFSLETGWGSGGAAGFYGGFGRTNPTDLSGTEYFNFWINPDPGQAYTLEINLQEDDNADGAATTSDDDEFQFDCVVGPAGPCAVSGGGWQLVSIPLADFVDDNSYFNGGNGVLDPTPSSRGGNGELINVVVAVIGTGSDVNFRTDYWAFSSTPIVPAVTVIDDFESGVTPGGPCPAGGLPLGFCTFSGAGSSVSLANPATPPAPELPAAGSPNRVLQMDVASTSFAGFIHGFTNPAMDTWVPQDWSTSEGISFWMYGSGSGPSCSSTSSTTATPARRRDDAERWTVPFADDFTGWQLLEFPFADVRAQGDRQRRTQRRARPGRDARLRPRGTRHRRSPDVLRRRGALYGVARPPAPGGQLLAAEHVHRGGHDGQWREAQPPAGSGRPGAGEHRLRDRALQRDTGSRTSHRPPGRSPSNGAAIELSFPVETFDNTKFTGDKQIVIRLTNPVDVERGALFQGRS